MNDSICKQTTTTKNPLSVQGLGLEWHLGEAMDQPPNLQRIGQSDFGVLLEGLGFICSFSRFPVIQGRSMSDNVSIE